MFEVVTYNVICNVKIDFYWHNNVLFFVQGKAKKSKALFTSDEDSDTESSRPGSPDLISGSEDDQDYRPVIMWMNRVF